MASDFETECGDRAYHASRIHEWLDRRFRESKIAKDAYALKGRTKPPYKIAEKVRVHRHRGEAKYSLDDVTDVSGFRIVRLFNAEVPEALDDLFSVVETLLAERENGQVKEVKEIEFHTSRRLDDPLSIHRDVLKVVDKHGLTPKLKRTKEVDGQGTASSYSSVHVLLECEVREGAVYSSCSEVQVRSVFEEAWSEISHRLHHAPTKASLATGAVPLTKVDPLFLLHLDALKSLTDGCAQYADLINRQLKSLETGRAEREPKPLDAAERSVALFRECSPEVQKAVEKAYQLRTDAEASKSTARPAAFQRAAEAFRISLEKFSKPATSEDQRLIDVLREELAFCYMFTESGELRDRAEKIYRDLRTRKPNSVSVLLRLGQLRRDAAAYPEAKELMEAGLAAAKHNHDPDPEVQRQANWLLRRDLAYIHWRLAGSDASDEDVLAHLDRARELSEEALQYASPKQQSEQQLNTQMNSLYYLADLRACLPDDRMHEWDGRGKQLLDEVRDKITPDARTEYLDSLARAEIAFGDRNRANDAASRVRQRLADRLNDIRKERDCSHAEAFDLMSRDERDMYLFALDVLSPR